MDIEKLVEEQREREAEQDALERDAERYRAMRDAIVSHRLWLYQNGFQEHEYLDVPEGIDLLADTLITEQAAYRRHFNREP